MSASEANMSKLVARCTSCDTLFDFSDQLPNAAASGAGTMRAPARQRGPVPMPASIVLREGPSLERTEPGALPYRDVGRFVSTDFAIVRRWYSARYIGMAFFCVAWDSFLLFWYSHVASAPWIFIVFPIAHVAVGVGLTYSTVAGFLNRTIIAVRGDRLTIRHGPVPWWGNQTLATEDLDQVYCQQKVSGRNNDSGPSITYVVAARMKDGRVVKLVDGLPEADQALFIEQAIETHLGIEDVPVGGEFAG